MRNNSTARKRLFRDLVSSAETMIQAGVSRTTRTCSTPSCGCHTDPSRRHGPHAYLTFRAESGKNSSLYVSPEHLEEAMAAKRAWDRFWEAAVQLAALNREEFKKRWQASRKARAAR